MNPLRHPVIFCLASIAALLQFGCDYIPPRPVLGTDPVENLLSFSSENTQENQEVETLEVDSDVERPFQQSLEDVDLWHACFVGKQRVGFRNIAISRVSKDSGTLRYTVIDYFAHQQNEQRNIHWVRQVFKESEYGVFQDLYSEAFMDGQVSIFAARVTGYNELESRWNGGPVDRNAWNEAVRGPEVVQRSLQAKPMQAGEYRKLVCILPPTYQVHDVELRAIGIGNVALMNNEWKPLLEIEQTILKGDQLSRRHLLWTGEDGEILKAHTMGTDFWTYRVDKDTAIDSFNTVSNLKQATEVPIQGSDKFESTSDVKFRVFSSKEFPTSERQSVDSQTKDSCEITCFAQGSWDALPPNDDDLSANQLLQSDHSIIKEIVAGLLLSESMSDQSKCERLRAEVFHRIDQTRFSPSLRPAVEIAVIETEGDCIEQAILFATLLRAAGIASRIGAGARYYLGESGELRMQYHMWTLAWLDDRWEAIDVSDAPSLSVPKNDRITFTTSNLKNPEDAARCVIPVLEQLSNMRVEVVR